MKVRHIGSNQVEIETDTRMILVSYQTPVACRYSNGHYSRTKQFWSRTTSKHINKWLDGYKATELGQDVFDRMLDQ